MQVQMFGYFGGAKLLPYPAQAGHAVGFDIYPKAEHVASQLYGPIESTFHSKPPIRYRLQLIRDNAGTPRVVAFDYGWIARQQREMRQQGKR